MSRAFLMPAALLLACAEGAAPHPADAARDREHAASEEVRLPVIYGADDRQEVFEHADEGARDVAQHALVALVPKERVTAVDSAIALASDSLSEALGVCDSERFVEQPTAADCSGVLIAPDLVLTAAHCFAGEKDCDRYAYVFDYFYAAAGRLEAISTADVARCKETVVRRLDASRSPLREDFAVVRLEHAVDPSRAFVSLRREPMHVGEPVTVLGFPSGLPAKIDDGAVVRSPRVSSGDYFSLDSDTFRGSSGSPVLDARARLVGIIVRGGMDYVDDADAGCAVPRTVLDQQREEWEQATYVTRVLEAVCEDPERAPTLCKTEPTCGDGICEHVEAGSCPADCVDMCSLSLCRPSEESEQRIEALLETQVDTEPDARRDESAAAHGCTVLGGTAKAQSAWGWAVLGLSIALARRRRASRASEAS